MNSTTGSAAASDHAGLLQAVAANQDTDAFQALFTWYAPRIKSVMRRQGADEVMAEELSQETLLMVWRKSHLSTRLKRDHRPGYSQSLETFV